MSDIKSVCVFCGASNNVAKEFLDEGRELGRMIAERGMNMVFGAGDCGVMGATANGALDAGGTVTGVFPRVLDGLEEEHKSLTETIIVDDMHTRKMNMFHKSDAFIILPGGFGTMDETFEVITWKQLHTHNKPIIFYNYNGYWDKWVEMTNHFIDNGFASQQTRTLYDVVDSLEEVFEKL
ncbi:TIGR00730 family Rossman fold protein [Rickettsiales bacterium]|nr:TIGR00730 family Rossman fold protein [Rickettsiales bacterium]